MTRKARLREAPNETTDVAVAVVKARLMAQAGVTGDVFDPYEPGYRTLRWALRQLGLAMQSSGEAWDWQEVESYLSGLLAGVNVPPDLVLDILRGD